MFYNVRRRIPSISLGVALLGMALSISLHAPQPARADVATPSSDDIAHWVKDLDSDIFVARQEAGRKLFDAGRAAIAPLSEAADGKSLEVTTAAVDILRRLAQSTADVGTAQAAKGALEKIAQGENTSAASLAKEAIAPLNNPHPAFNRPQQFPGIRPNIIIGQGGGNIQLLPGGGVRVFRIQANVNNGNRSIDVNENGKHVKIDENQNGIEMKVTESINGKEKIDTFKAKDADELKKKFPEAGKLYDKYSQQQGGIIFAGGGAIQIQGQAFPAPFGQPAIPQFPGIVPVIPNPPNPVGPRKDAATDIEEARKLIAEATQSIRENAAPGNKSDAAKAEADQKAAEKLEHANRKLDEAHKKLGG